MGEIVNTENRRESTYMQLADETTFEQWLDIGSKLIQTTQNIMWWLGDWWNFGERKYGEAASQALSMEIPYSTFSKASYVARQIEKERRLPEVSWSIHCEIAQLNQQDQDLFLSKARDSNYSVSRTREEVKKHKVQELLDDNDKENIMLYQNINIKSSNVWTFGKPMVNYGVNDDQKTPPQMLFNLFYWFEDRDLENLSKVVDLTDKYQVTYDVANDFNFECNSYDLYPHAETKKVKAGDWTVDHYPKELKEADIVILNILDYLDNAADIDPASFIRQQIINLSTAMKPGSQLFFISKDLDDCKLENIFSLIYDDTDFSIIDFISIPNKDTYSKEEEVQAIANRTLLNKFGYVFVLRVIDDSDH